MIRYGVFVVLLLFVNISKLEGADCDEFKDAFKSYYQCILSCYKDVFEITHIAGDICTTDIELSGMTQDQFPISSIEDSIDCITARCRTAFPPSVCEGSTTEGGADTNQGLITTNNGDTSITSGSSGTGGSSILAGEDEYYYEEYDCVEVDDDEQGGGGAAASATASDYTDDSIYYYSDEDFSYEGESGETENNQPVPILLSGDSGEAPVQPGNQAPANIQPPQPTSNNQATAVASTNTGGGPGGWWSFYSNGGPADANSYDATGNSGPIVNSYDATGNAGPIVNSYDTTGNVGQNTNYYGSAGNYGYNGNNYGLTGNNGYYNNFGNAYNQQPNYLSYGNNFGNSYDATGNAGSYGTGDNGYDSVSASAAAVNGNGGYYQAPIAPAVSAVATAGNAPLPPVGNVNVGSDYYAYNPAASAAATAGNAQPPQLASPNVDYNYGSNAAASAAATAGSGLSDANSVSNMLSMLSNTGAANLGLQDGNTGPITLNFGDDMIVIDGKQVQWHRNNQLMNTFDLN